MLLLQVSVPLLATLSFFPCFFQGAGAEKLRCYDCYFLEGTSTTRCTDPGESFIKDFDSSALSNPLGPDHKEPFEIKKPGKVKALYCFEATATTKDGKEFHYKSATVIETEEPMDSDCLDSMDLVTKRKDLKEFNVCFCRNEGCNGKPPERAGEISNEDKESGAKSEHGPGGFFRVLLLLGSMVFKYHLAMLGQ